MSKTKNTIIDKVFKYIKNKGESVSLKEIYEALPNHTTSSIRGNINREIKKENSILKREEGKRGFYNITTDYEVVDNGDTVSLIETTSLNILDFSLFKKKKEYVYSKKNLNVAPLKMTKVSGENYSFWDAIDGLIEANEVVENTEKPVSVDRKKHLSLVGATRTDKGKTREDNDFYPTPDNAIMDILERESLMGSIWEPCCGDGAISKLLKKYYPFANIHSSDLIDRGYGDRVGVDFLKDEEIKEIDNIITNPPFKFATDIIEKSLKIAKNKVIMLLKIQALEGIDRYLRIFKDSCLRKVYVYVKRLSMYKGTTKGSGSSTMCFAWFVWDKQYNGCPQIDWIY